MEYAVGKRISSQKTSYKVQKYLGKGSFGTVTECRKETTNETVALKIFKSKEQIRGARIEEDYMRQLKELDADRFNIVRLNDSFAYEGRYYLEFEKLDVELFDFIRKGPTRSLNLKKIRPILQQLATALDFLKSKGITHGDLKPQNIMMVDHLMNPLRVKVIDFGLALNNPADSVGNTIQTLAYRSPEVLLGAPFNEAIDVWSLGCIAGEMFLGTQLFAALDKYDMMKKIVETIGKPNQALLAAGKFTHDFFWPLYWRGSTRWIFISLDELGESYKPSKGMSNPEELMKLCHASSRIGGDASECDLANFINLLTQMLKVNSSERITPRGILEHPFITMSDLQGAFNNSPYVKSCMDLMSVCQDQSSPSGEDAEQTTLQTSLNEGTSTSAVSKTKKRNESGNSQDESTLKRRQTDQLRVSLAESQKKRKMDDLHPTSDVTPPHHRKNETMLT